MADTLVGCCTSPVAALVSVSECPSSSVKLTRTLTVLPASAVARVYVCPVAPEMSVSDVRCHCVSTGRRKWTSCSGRLRSPIPDVSALRVSPTCSVPLMVGVPVAGEFCSGPAMVPVDGGG